MLRRLKREKKTDGDRPGPGTGDRLGNPVDLLAAQRDGHVAGGDDPFPDSENQVVVDKGPGISWSQIIKVAPGLPSDAEQVFETRRRHEGGASAAPFQECIGGDGGTVDDGESR